MKNSIILMLLCAGLGFSACSSDSATSDAATKANTKVEDANKLDASKEKATSPLNQPQNKVAVDAAKKTVKGDGTLPNKVLERRNKLQLKNQKGLMQQRKSLKKLDLSEKPLIKKQ